MALIQSTTPIKNTNPANYKFLVFELEPTLIILSGGSGTGKSTLANMLTADPELNIKRLITTTTRLPREGEKDGKDYYFVTTGEFDNSVLKQQFLEHVEYNGRFYGTHKDALDFVLKRQKTNALLILDTKGMFKLRDYCKTFGYQYMTFWIETPTITNMINHMKSRRTEPEEIINRLVIWEQEAQSRNQYDKVIVVDDHPELIAKRIKDLVLEKYGK